MREINKSKKISAKEEIKININEQWELEWWPWRLGISRKELVAAVQCVGPVLYKVKEYISARTIILKDVTNAGYARRARR